MLKRGLLCVGATLSVMGWQGPAQALEYCVTCEDPPALYRCVIEGTPDGPGKDPTSSLFCISELAKRGKHERCAVSRGAPFPCPGLTALLPPPAATPGLAAPPVDPAPAEAHPDTAAQTPAEQPEPAPAPVPRTVEELAGQTVKSSKEGLEKAGKAIGGTAKKAGEQIGAAGSAIGNAASQTWNCISSFFSDCSGTTSGDGSSPEAHPEHEPQAE